MFDTSCAPHASLHGPENFGDTLCAAFQSRFEVLSADTPELIRQAQEVRYQVYCSEHAFLPIENPQGIETDEFDSHAVHTLLLSRQTGVPLGTVRLIMPLANALERSFVVQRLLDASALKMLHSLPLHSMAEVSRFSISRQFRRVMTDRVEGNSGPLMRLGLFQGLVRMSIEHGISHWCALMEPTLLRMFSAMAIRCQPIGPLVEFHGLRQPCFMDVYAMLDTLMRERPAFWEIMTNRGALRNCAVAA